MAPRIYTSVMTVGDISFYEVTSDPNGALTATQGSIAVRSDLPITYQNINGTDTWKLLGSSATLPTPQISILQGIQANPESPPPDGGGPFTIQVRVLGVTQDMVNMGARLWLYRYAKNRNVVRGGLNQKVSRFVHPSTNTTPQFSNISGEGDQYGDGGGALIRSIQTEWVLAVGDQTIDVTIDPQQWYRGPIVFPVPRSTWNDDTQYGLYAQSGSLNPGSRKTAIFSFRTVVNDPAFPANPRPLYGAFSGNLLLSPRLNGTDYVQWQVRTKQT